VEAQYLAGVAAVNKPRWLAHIDLLTELSIQERRLHVHVVDLSFELSGDGEQKPDIVQSSDRGKTSSKSIPGHYT